MTTTSPFGARSTLATSSGELGYFSLGALADAGVADPDKLPVTVKILLENLLRLATTRHAGEDDVAYLAGWGRTSPEDREFPFAPARVILQDFTGVPATVDLAAMRTAIEREGGDPSEVDPLVPVDLVIDHSVQVDSFGSAQSYTINVEREYERNHERYSLLRWAQQAFAGFRVVPPGMGIVHQVNLEHIARVVHEVDGVAVFDTLVGTDSHTTMINGLGVLGWGVGGIEAEAALLGQPLPLVTPKIVGFGLTGELQTGVTATDLVLTVTEMLRKHGVVGKFVEFYGRGLSNLTVADRATIGNMSPEFGSTAAFFPVDERTIEYLRLTGRPDEVVDLADRYSKEQGVFRTDDTPDPVFTETLTLDLSTVEPSVAGPRRPQDRVALASIWDSFEAVYPPKNVDKERVSDGAVVIAAITSCTNTSNPSVMLAAGILAKKAVEKGLQPASWVKTSLAPGSRVVTEYLEGSGLLPYLEKLGFNVVGYGCTTCIGNSGPLPDDVAAAIDENDFAVVSVLSGNRNFEGRIHPQVKASYLASPPLVVAFALAGRADIDLTTEPLGAGPGGEPVYLKDLWPAPEEVAEAMSSVTADLFTQEYAKVFDGDEHWRELPSPTGSLYEWDPESTYVQEPPFFTDLGPEPAEPASGGLGRRAEPGDIRGARVLCLVGDSVTTDHISPAGSIAPASPAGRYLKEQGVDVRDFNSYGSRRGNHEVMMRGTFANIRFRNVLAEGKEGGWTKKLPEGEVTTIFEASEAYRADGTPLLIIAGKEYGSGSSRDWAAKGPALLGVKAAIAESFERIHRSNLVGMGVLPLQFRDGENAESLGLTGHETYEITGIEGGLKPHATLNVKADEVEFEVECRIDSAVELDYYRHGGVLQMVLRRMLAEST